MIYLFALLFPVLSIVIGIVVAFHTVAYVRSAFMAQGETSRRSAKEPEAAEPAVAVAVPLDAVKE